MKEECVEHEVFDGGAREHLGEIDTEAAFTVRCGRAWIAEVVN